jgi:hypothetical protein
LLSENRPRLRCGLPRAGDLRAERLLLFEPFPLEIDLCLAGRLHARRPMRLPVRTGVPRSVCRTVRYVPVAGDGAAQPADAMELRQSQRRRNKTSGRHLLIRRDRRERLISCR